jgi:hypothetical protein
MPVIQAEEKLWELEVAGWTRAPVDQQEVERRNAFRDKLVAIASRADQEYETDENGRQILIGYEAVKNWFNYWLSQG